MSDDRLARLAGLAALIRDTELDRMRRCAEEGRVIDARIRTLRAAGRATGADMAAFAGAADAWADWRQARLTDLSLEAARAAAAIEEQRLRARRAFGRASVLTQLATRR